MRTFKTPIKDSWPVIKPSFIWVHVSFPQHWTCFPLPRSPNFYSIWLFLKQVCTPFPLTHRVCFQFCSLAFLLLIRDVLCWVELSERAFCRSRTIRHAQWFKPNRPRGHQMCCINPAGVRKGRQYVRVRIPKLVSPCFMQEELIEIIPGKISLSRCLEVLPLSTWSYLVFTGRSWNHLAPKSPQGSLRMLSWRNDQAVASSPASNLRFQLPERNTGELGIDSTISDLICSFWIFLGLESQCKVLKTAFFFFFWFETKAVMHC